MANKSLITFELSAPSQYQRERLHHHLRHERLPKHRQHSRVRRANLFSNRNRILCLPFPRPSHSHRRTPAHNRGGSSPRRSRDRLPQIDCPPHRDSVRRARVPDVRASCTLWRRASWAGHRVCVGTRRVWCAAERIGRRNRIGIGGGTQRALGVERSWIRRLGSIGVERCGVESVW